MFWPLKMKEAMLSSSRGESGIADPIEETDN